MSTVPYGPDEQESAGKKTQTGQFPPRVWPLSKRGRSVGLLFTLLLVAVSALPEAARADDTGRMADSPSAPERESKSDWQFSVSPYLWMAGVQGTVRQFDSPPARLDSDFGQIFNELDYAFMGILEGRRGRYSVFADIAYTKTSVKDPTPKGILAEKIGVASQSFSGLLGGGYTIHGTGRAHLDLIAGLRVWSVSTKLSFHGGILDHVTQRDSATWVDMVAGFRGTYSFTDSVYLTGWGNIGAGQADLDWDVVAGVGYKINTKLSAVAGYRIQGVDYRKNGFEYDVIQKGPIMGFTYRF
ncbi:hypothetical protein FOC84_06660 [Achromobacter pestifer]|uniref:Uncharacterized protein n=1 Tax=Achromobacter pestifer TaxID=1353889 RepID=A0A7D4DX01_9BURK|nr:hypothetical protein [Achromobacter pestifer]QKH34647.1 hypothetical protein FOC84_06660 [Achromobacter pestifer]